MQQTTLRVVDDFVDVATLSKLVEGEVWSYGWRSNMGATETPFWHIHFCGSRRPDEFIRQDEALLANPRLEAIASVWERIKDQVTPEYQLVRCYANGHTYGLDGHVHRDAKPGEDALTALVYINSSWQPEWAGETVFISEDGECQAVLPKPGRLVVFDGTVQHVARSPSRECSALRMTLVFKLVRNDALDLLHSPMPKVALLSFLRRRGALAAGHSGRSLLDHLIGTWRILSDWECEEHVRLAGLFHSIYGTSIYQRQTVTLSDRAAVRRLIGDRAEELAFVFCVLDRPKAWSGALSSGKAALRGIDDARVTLAPDMIDDLLTMEIANLIEQGNAEGPLSALVTGGANKRDQLPSMAKTALAEACAALATVT